jgi:hypothetical protein
MIHVNRWRCFLAIFCFACLPGSALGQATPQKKTLVVNGHSAAAAVVQLDGHSYVDIETLAQVTNATLSIQSDRIIMKMPGPGPVPKSTPAATEMSKEFATSGITLLEEMREWQGAISGAIRQGVAAGTWLTPFLQQYRSRAQKGMEQASVAATNPQDHRALQLLKNEFGNLSNWDSQTQAAIQALNAEQTVSPSARQDDPLLTRISDCGDFLSVMMVSREFADNPSCH